MATRFKCYTYIATPEDQIGIGRLYPVAGAGAECCQSSTVQGDTTEHRWGCTRAKGHKGLHVAHTGTGQACAIWNDSAPLV